MVKRFFLAVWAMLVFFAIQYAVGRRGSFPYGIMVHFSLLKISVLVVISDILQTILLLNSFEFISKRLLWWQNFKARVFKKTVDTCEKKESRFKRFGLAGIFFVSALPYGGGALSGSILAISINERKWRAFFMIILGCMVSTVFYYLSFKGVLVLFKW
jgi:uncharacterized membrane protein